MKEPSARAFDPARFDEAREFSATKLGTFQGCPRRYHYHYIDRIRGERRGVEAHLGSSAHAALEELYRAVLRGRVPPFEEVLAWYERAWEAGLAKGPVALPDDKASPEDWRAVGRQCLRNYDSAHRPFDEDRTVAVEQRVGFPLDVADPESGSTASYRIDGFVDRLSVDPQDGFFVVHDYKTSATLPTEAELKEDVQLAIYAIAVLDSWPQSPGVRLRWHYLRFGKTIKVVHTPVELGLFRGRIAERIRRIKRERAFEPVKSPLCGWCEYRDICPVWKHVEAYAQLPENERARESGVQLVDRYAALESRKKSLRDEIAAIESELEELEGKVLHYADARDLRAIAGSDGELEVSSKEEFRFPTRTHDPEKLEVIESELKATPVWSDVSRLDSRSLMEGYRDRRWPLGVLELVEGWLGKLIRRETVRGLRLHRRREGPEE